MPELLHSTIGGWMDKMAREHGDREALVYHDRGLRLTYRELNDVARRAARALVALGVKKGDHVAVWATNTPEWVYTLHGCAKIGAVLVTVNTNYKIFELEYLLRQSDAKVLIFSDGIKTSDYHEILGELLKDLSRVPVLRHLIHMDEPGGKKATGGILPWSRFIQMSDEVPAERLDEVQAGLDEHDMINMQYTSGTTGFPKGVMLTHHNILNNGFFIGENMKFTPRDRLCICVPFFHCFGLVLAQMACITHASAMVPVEVYSPAAVMETVQAERCTALHGVPTMFIFILDHPDFAKYDFSSLRTGIMAGSTCPVEVMRRANEELGQRELVSVFGQTECSPGMTMSHAEDTFERRTTTVGKLLPFTEGKVIDPETGEEVPPGTPGEIVTRGYHLMKGYYNMPEATAAAIDADGWLHTGDIGTCDEEGYYVITGRLKDMIIRGGENIYPREIEELLYTCPDVQDSQVVGVQSKKFGEEVAAFVIKREGSAASEADIKEYVSARMSRHKVPSHVFFINSLPMNAAGKILKYKLREQAEELVNREKGV
ncbi:MAG: AMP-binding protein [Oscillospiraceae bacterium]|jgi:fatty-acyl-CoA synthase|nr:AMP-binding protein [Oscillospiraceae bacterium]